MIHTNRVSGDFRRPSCVLGDWVEGSCSLTLAPWPDFFTTKQSLTIPSTSVRLGWVVETFNEIYGRDWNAVWYYPLLDEPFFLQFAAQRIEDAKAARQSVENLRTLEDNWDGYGGSSVSPQARQHALRFIDMIEAAPGRLPFPEISPTPSGTIAFEWEAHETVVYVEIGNTRYSGYIRLDRQQPTFLQGQADYLDQQIVAAIQRAIVTPVTPSPSITKIQTAAMRYESLAA